MRPLRGTAGRFAGSVGDGAVAVPTAPPASTPEPIALSVTPGQPPFVFIEPDGDGTWQVRLPQVGVVAEHVPDPQLADITPETDVVWVSGRPVWVSVCHGCDARVTAWHPGGWCGCCDPDGTTCRDIEACTLPHNLG